MVGQMVVINVTIVAIVAIDIGLRVDGISGSGESWTGAGHCHEPPSERTSNGKYGGETRAGGTCRDPGCAGKGGYA